MEIVEANIDFRVIGERIREARKRKEWSQAKLSEKIDVAVVYISRIERGDAQINLKRLAQVAKALDVSMSELLTGISPEHGRYLNQEWEQVLSKCTPAKQRLIYDIAKKIAGLNI